MVIFKSNFSSVPIPNSDIYSFFTTPNEKNKTKDLNKPLFIDGETGKHYSWNNVLESSSRLASGWRNNVGLKEGETVAIFAPNHLDHPILYFSLLAARCTISPGNPAYTSPEFEHQIRNCKATTLVTTPALLPILSKIWEKIGNLRSRIFLFGDREVDGCRPFRSISHNKPIEKANRKSEADDVAFICYSSGTTGLAKGVMLTHKNFIAQTMLYITGELEKEETANECTLGFLPFYHIYGLNSLILMAFYKVIPVVIMSRYDLELMCQLIEKYRITSAVIVPPVAVHLAKSPIVSKYDLSSIKDIGCGAAPLSEGHIDSLTKRIPSLVRQGYGMTETTSGVIFQNAENHSPGCIGVLFPNVEYLGANQEGELLFRGPTMMKGYFDNPKANAEIFTSDGWLRTGDIGKFDSTVNEFRIVDRIKELIKYKGYQVAPAELEAVLMSMDIVADCCVIGVYDEAQATEIPRAYVVTQANVQQNQKTSEHIISYIEKNVTNHKRLRGGIRFVNTIPKSPSGKILRRQVREWSKAEQKSRARL